jgi:phage gp36-like protein
MPYATQTDLVDRYGAQELMQLTDPVAASAINAETVARALADADAEIDARLGGRYALPLTVVPTLLVRMACDIARFYLWGDSASEPVRNRYKDATGLLDKVATGLIPLPAAVPLEPGGGGVAVTGRSPAPVFSAAALDRYSPSL